MSMEALAEKRGLPETFLTGVGVSWLFGHTYEIKYPHLTGEWTPRLYISNRKRKKYLSEAEGDTHLYNPGR